MSAETPLIAAAAAILIAVIGLVASVHYRLGKLEEGQKALGQEDVHTRELLAETREMLVRENAHTRELLAETREMLVKENAHTRELLAETREMLVRENAHTRELLSQLIMQEIAALRERSDAQHAETMGAIQRLTDAFLSHSHDIDGTIRFRIPPPLATPPAAEEET